MEKEVRANNGKSLLLPYPKMLRVFFKHAPRNNEMKGFIL